MKDPNAPAGGIVGNTPLVVVLVLAVIVGWTVWWVVRYLRADTMTRQSIRQAVRVRWGWKRLAPMLKLSATDKTPTALATLANTNGKPIKPRILIPALKVTHDAYGVIARAQCLPALASNSSRRLPHIWRMPGGAHGWPSRRTGRGKSSSGVYAWTR